MTARRDALVAAQRRWLATLAAEGATRDRAGELPRGTDPEDIAWGLNAIAMGVNQGMRLLADHGAVARGRRARDACPPRRAAGTASSLR